ncbi:MAG: sulfurtransferase [Pyrinomonadaceae bacterium]|nr:sulfurtransferase [Pyrinomonadaceae bacterium]
MNRALLTIVLSVVFCGSLFANEKVVRFYEAPPVVSVAWLSEHIADENLVLLHIGREPEYKAGHIPGARYISTRDISTTREESKLRLQIPPISKLKATFEKLGVSNDSRIVLYFGKDWTTPMTRVYFMLDYLGLRNNTSILDGGMPAWVASGKSLSKKAAASKPGSLNVKANPDLVATSEWINSKLKDSNVKIVDARTPNHYTASTAASYPRPGHLPGAKNIPYRSIVDENLKLKDEKALRKLFTDAGIKPNDTVVTYCHIGQQASLVYFAAKKLGYKVKLYDGSFEEWSADKRFEVVGPGPDKR